MLVYCVIGTEEETGEDKAGEVSTGRGRATAGDELLLPGDWCRSLGAPVLSSCGRHDPEKESRFTGEGIL